MNKEKVNYKIFYNLIDFFFQNSFAKSICKIINKSKLNKEINIFDIGCYIGNFSREIKKNIKRKLKVNYYLFDPNPNIKLDDFNYNCIGISNKIKKKKFYYNTFFPSSGSGFSTITRKDILWNLSRRLITFSLFKKFTTFEVKTDTLDNFCYKKKISKIELIKIDTEGHEFEVLLGAKKILGHTKIIQIEIMDTKKKFIKKFTKINNFLHKYNFKLLKKKKQWIASLLSNITIVDYLYIKN
jgi:hypothetical protein